MNWLIRWRTHSFTRDDLSGRHLMLIGIMLGSDSWEIDPMKPSNLMAILRVWLTEAEGRSDEDVLAELLAAKWPEFDAAVTTTES